MPCGQHMAIIDFAACIWICLVLQSIVFIFASTGWSSGPAEKYEQVIGSKGPPAFLCFPIFSFLFKKVHFLSLQKCQKLLMPSSMFNADKKNKNDFCNSCLVGLVCNLVGLVCNIFQFSSFECVPHNKVIEDGDNTKNTEGCYHENITLFFWILLTNDIKIVKTR